MRNTGEVSIDFNYSSKICDCYLRLFVNGYKKKQTKGDEQHENDI